MRSSAFLKHDVAVWSLVTLLVALSGAVALMALGLANSALADWTRLLAIGAVLQLALVARSTFQVGWCPAFAYWFHWVFVGGACVAGAMFDLFGEPTKQLDSILLAGMCGQLALGLVALRSRPRRVTVEFNRGVLQSLVLVCGVAALIKFGSYAQQIIAEGGHLAIYLEGASVRDSTPLLIRGVAMGAPTVALIALAQRDVSAWAKLLALASLIAEFGIGTRSRPVFLVASLLVLVQSRIPQGGAFRAMVVSLTALGAGGLIAIGYFREGYDIAATAYLLVTFESLTGTVQAAVTGASLHDPGPLVITQFWPLLFPSDIGVVDTVAKFISSAIIPDAYEEGYGLSSSALLEISMLASSSFAFVVYPFVVVAAVALVSALVSSRKPVVYLAGVALLPAIFYLWRAELWQPAVQLLKAAPFLLLLAAAAVRKGQRPQEARAGGGWPR